MKIRLMSPALIRRHGETCDASDLPDGVAASYIASGVAVEIKAKKKATTAKKKTGEKRSTRKKSDE